MEQINLNLIPGSVRPVCHATQNDVGRQIRCNLFDGASVFTFASGDAAALHLKKPNGESLTGALSVSSGQSYVDLITSGEMTDKAGAGLGCIQITRSGQVIGTLNFIMEIQEDPAEGEGPGPEPQGAGLKSTNIDIQNAAYTAAPLEEV